jgi:hypothetical protein
MDGGMMAGHGMPANFIVRQLPTARGFVPVLYFHDIPTPAEPDQQIGTAFAERGERLDKAAEIAEFADERAVIGVYASAAH